MTHHAFPKQPIAAMKLLLPVFKTISPSQSGRTTMSHHIGRTIPRCLSSLCRVLRTNAGLNIKSQKKEYSTGIDEYQLDIPELQEERNYVRKGNTSVDYSTFESPAKTKVKQLKCEGLPIVHHHGYVSDLPTNHRFAMRKFHGVMKFLRKDDVVSMKQVVMPEPVSEEVAMLAHTEDYVYRFYRGLTTEKEQRQTGFVWNEGLLRRCRLEAGGTILGAQLALQRGLACSTGGGTHHAHPGYGSGFCLLNDLAITARHLLHHRLAQRVLIVDLDVHQGDGSAAILKDDEDVFTFSVHCESNFPFIKPQSDLDLGLADHTDDAGYQRALTDHLPALLESFRPDLVLFDAGVDPHIKDNLGKLDLTDKGLFNRDMYVFQQCIERGIPCMSVIGGGYSRDINELSLRHTIVHRAAMKVWRERQP